VHSPGFLHSIPGWLLCTNVGLPHRLDLPGPDYGLVKRHREQAPAVFDENVGPGERIGQGRGHGRRRGQHALYSAEQQSESAPSDGPEAVGTDAAHPDAFLAGHRVIRLLGTGNRAVVLLGHSGTGNAVALKVFHRHTDASSIELDIAVLTSTAVPGLVRLLDVGHADDGRVCLVMERLSGGSLARYLIEHPSLSPGEAVTILAPIVVALGALHEAGFVHGNLSQATILLDHTGRAVITGFGAVQMLRGTARDHLTLLRLDWTRLHTVLENVLDTVDATAEQHSTASLLMRHFHAVLSPAGLPPERGQEAPEFDSVLSTLEHALFDWADAKPLRGFYDVGALDPQTLAVSGDRPRAELRFYPREKVPVQSVGTAAIARGARDIKPGRNAHHAPNGMVLGHSLAGVISAEDGCAHPAIGDSRKRFLHFRRAIRCLSSWCSVRCSWSLHKSSRSGVLASAIDSHPLHAAGHILRKRLHDHQRPLLVAALSCASILVLALTFFPLSGRASVNVRNSPRPSTSSAGPQQIGEPLQSTVEGENAHTSVATAVTGDDPVAAVTALLSRRESCLATLSIICLVEVDQSGSTMLRADSYAIRERSQGGSGEVSLDYRNHAASLAERSGDLAVVVLLSQSEDKESQPTSVLVIKGENGWRLREIFEY